MIEVCVNNPGTLFRGFHPERFKCDTGVRARGVSVGKSLHVIKRVSYLLLYNL